MAIILISLYYMYNITIMWCAFIILWFMVCFCRCWHLMAEVWVDMPIILPSTRPSGTFVLISQSTQQDVGGYSKYICKKKKQQLQ